MPTIYLTGDEKKTSVGHG